MPFGLVNVPATFSRIMRRLLEKLQTDDVRHPVVFASKKLSPREKNYSPTVHEALAIVWSVQKFQNYLYWQHFIAEMDHCPWSSWTRQSSLDDVLAHTKGWTGMTIWMGSASSFNELGESGSQVNKMFHWVHRINVSGSPAWEQWDFTHWGHGQ